MENTTNSEDVSQVQQTLLHKLKTKMTECLKPKKPEITLEFLQEHIGQDEIDELENKKNLKIESGSVILILANAAIQMNNFGNFVNRELYFIIIY